MSAHKNPKRCQGCKNYAPGHGAKDALTAKWKGCRGIWTCAECIKKREDLETMARMPREGWQPELVEQLTAIAERTTSNRSGRIGRLGLILSLALIASAAHGDSQ